MAASIFSAYLHKSIKDDGFLKSIIPLAMGFNFKMSVGFYAIVGMHQFEHNQLSWSCLVGYGASLQ